MMMAMGHNDFYVAATEDAHASAIARAAEVPITEARARLARIEADAELREAFWKLYGQTSDAVVVVDARRNAQGDIELGVAPDPGIGSREACARQKGKNLAQMRHEIAIVELIGLRTRKRFVPPSLAHLLVRA